LTGVLFACAAGLFFSALNVTMRRALGGVADVDAGSAAIALVALVLIAATTVASPALVAAAGALVGAAR
jgi:hypothetical protein